MTHEIKLQDCDVITCYDPARTREAEYGNLARSAIMTTACDSDYNVYLLAAYAARTSLDKIYEEVCRQCEAFNPRMLGVEDVATQIAIGDAFRMLSQRDGIRLPPIESLRPDTRINKKWRIKTIIQRYGPYQKLFAMSDAYEFRSEFGGFPKGRTIDLVDIYAYCLAAHNIPDNDFASRYNDEVINARRHSQGRVIEMASYNRDYDPSEQYKRACPQIPKSPEGFRVIKVS